MIFKKAWSQYWPQNRNLQNLDDKALKRLLMQLVPIINNSMVGTSKVLHFLAPESMPIIDSRVIRVWKKKFKNDNVPLRATPLVDDKLKRVVDNYVNYRKYLQEWQKKCGGNVSLRDLESVLYYQKLK